MNVTSVLEIYTTYAGFLFANQINELLTAVLAIPFIVMILRALFESSQSSGFRSGIKQAVAIIEPQTYVMLLVIGGCFVPLIPLQLNSLRYDASASITSTNIPEEITAANDPTTYAETAKPSVERLSSTYGEPRISLITAAVIRISYGVNHVLQKRILDASQNGDLRLAQFNLSQYKLATPALTAESQNFASDCYARARSKFFSWTQLQQENNIPSAALQEVIDNPSVLQKFSADVYRLTPGLYQRCRDSSVCQETITARNPVEGFPYTVARYGVRGNFSDPNAAPYCDEWWESLSRRIIEATPNALTFTERLSERFELGTVDNGDVADRIIQNTMNDIDISVSQFDQATETNLDKLQNVVSAGYLAIESVFSDFNTTPMRVNVSIFLALVLLVTYTFSPIILFLTGFSASGAIGLYGFMFSLILAHSTLTLVQFADRVLYSAVFNSNSFFEGFLSINQQSFNFYMNIVYAFALIIHFTVFGLAIKNAKSSLATNTQAGAGSTKLGAGRTAGNIGQGK